jgi:Xaa-Pro aminopeptidase
VALISDADVANWFTYHSPTEEQVPKYEAIRAAGKALAEAIRVNCPDSADRSAALRKVREACFTANSSIACGGR